MAGRILYSINLTNWSYEQVLTLSGYHNHRCVSGSDLVSGTTFCPQETVYAILFPGEGEDTCLGYRDVFVVEHDQQCYFSGLSG